MPTPTKSAQWLAAVFLAGVIALSFPFLAIFDRRDLVLGIPVLYLYLFVLWALIIGTVFYIVEKRRP
ncbi:MAG: hypothetical protein ACPGU7_13970 [Gammaproteobacteria bacterium]